MRPNLKNTTLKTGNLILDARNARLPPGEYADQRSLIHILLEREDIKKLAQSIARLGLFPTERLVVMAQGRRFVVLEGNRRVTAIKLLLNPELAPSSASVSHFRRLAGKADLTSLVKMDVVVVSTRLEAAPIIANLHTGSAKKGWSALQQARFYRGLVNDGLSASEVAEDTATTLGEVNSFLRAEKLYRIALTLDYPDPVRAKVDDPRFPLTTLERFIESRTGQKFLGVELDDVHGFRGVVHPDRFRAVLRKITEDVTKQGMSRVINKVEDFQKYIDKAKAELPRTNVRGSFLPDDLLLDQSPRSDSDDPDDKGNKKPPPRRISKSVVPTGFQCNSKHDRVRSLFTELRGINIKTQPNSSGVMLRVLLDVALWNFVKDGDHVEAICNHFDQTRKKRRHNKTWTPSLRDVLSYAVDNELFPEVTPDGYKALRSLASKSHDEVITIETFNAFTHNPYVTPLESELRALWQRAQPALEVILGRVENDRKE